MKRCNKCREIKPENAFGKKKSCPDGLNRWCKECRNADYRQRKTRTLPPGDPRHGTKNGIVNFSCKCGLCRAKRAEILAAQRARGLEPSDPRHGSRYGYEAWGCRCELCTEAQAQYDRFRNYQWTDEMEEAYRLTLVCDRCHEPFDSNKWGSSKAVDHDHVHGFVRGVIHISCNKNLKDKGRDTAQMLEDAKAAGDTLTAEYLAKSVQTT